MNVTETVNDDQTPSNLLCDIKLHRRSQQESSLDDGVGDPVRVDVGGGPPVLEVSVSLLVNMTGDSDGCTSVGNTGREGSDVASLVLSGQSELVVFTVNGNVLHVTLSELLDSGLNGLHTDTGGSRRLGRVVGVATGTVPVTGAQGLGVERRSDPPFFTDPEQQEPGHPQVISHLDSRARPDLELPLRRHHFGVDSRDVDTSVETSSVVSLDEITSKHLSSTDTTVVRTLRTGETALGPSERLTVSVEESVLLLKTEPGFLVLGQFHGLGGEVPVVVGSRGTVGQVTSAENQDVVSTSERIWVHGDGSEEDIGVVTWGLLST